MRPSEKSGIRINLMPLIVREMRLELTKDIIPATLYPN